jgi:hypothetical protein
MKLESQVCSFANSKRLKQLGVRQDSLFYWEDDSSIIVSKNDCENTRYFCEDDYYSAFTASEVLELLPPMTNNKLILKIGKSLLTNGYYVRYKQQKKKGILINKYDLSLSNSLANMLVHLIENNLMENNQ